MTPRQSKSSILCQIPGELAQKKSIMGALRLYLDFINLFIMMLQLFGNRE
jgi:Integral membrane protein, interacts with FtsH